MTGPNMLIRANLQPRLAHLIAGLRQHQVEEAVGLLLDYVDAGRKATWHPQFDAMSPKQEALAVQFCEEIAGPRGQPGRLPDPVRLLEMAEALYDAERKDQAQ